MRIPEPPALPPPTSAYSALEEIPVARGSCGAAPPIPELAAAGELEAVGDAIRLGFLGHKTRELVSTGWTQTLVLLHTFVGSQLTVAREGVNL